MIPKRSDISERLGFKGCLKERLTYCNNKNLFFVAAAFPVT